MIATLLHIASDNRFKEHFCFDIGNSININLVKSIAIKILNAGRISPSFREGSFQRKRN